MARLRDIPSGGDAGDRRWMTRALELAARGWAHVFPNPMAGAVVVKAGRLLGQGFHQEFGGPHAEVRALEAAGDEAAGATLYVTLEPCTHEGKTPPCTRAVLTAGVRRVVVACRDPDPAAGGGARALADGGVEVDVGVRAQAARRLNAAFFWNRVAERPWVHLKYALSLDARLARREGERTAVTGPEARDHVHWLRAGYQAILVGRRTVEVDDPRLTARGSVTPREPPCRVVLDPSLRTPPGSRLVGTSSRVPVWLVAAPDAPADRRESLEEAGVRVLEADRESDHRLRPASILRVLGDEGIGTLLVEGGGRVGSSFLRADLVDRMTLIQAPDLFGDDGVPAFVGPMPAEAGHWEPAESRALGRDQLRELDRARTMERIREET